jgi:hypothetical protein
MRETRISVPEIGLIAMTRAALGVGIGLLVSERIGGSMRRGVGWALVVTGALSTIPLVVDVFRKARSAETAGTNTNGRTGVKERPGTGVPAGMSTQPGA